MRILERNILNSTGISLIFVNKYIFSLLLFFNLQGYIAGGPVYKEFYLSIISLFIFLSIIFYFCEKYFSNLKFYNLILNCIICTLTFHIFLDLSNIPEWRHLRAEIFGLTTNKYLIAGWYVLPFLVSLIINILFFYNLKKIKKFLIILSIFFFGLFIFRFLSSVNPINEIQVRTENQFINDAEKKLIWIVFDEFDHKLALSEYSLENFNKFEKQSLKLTNMRATSNATISAIPEMLTGFLAKDVKIYDQFGKLSLVGDDGKMMDFNFDNSIFGKISKLGYSSSVFGVYHPYCHIFYQIKNCTPLEIHHRNIKWYDGIFHVTFLNLIDKFLDNKLNLDSDRDKFQIDLIEKHLNFKDNLTYMHFGFPHLPSLYAKKFFKIKPKNEIESYKLNLKLTDYVFNKILEEIEKLNFNKKTLIIVSSDHWYLKMDEERPVVFLAKFLYDNNKYTLDKETSNYHISELIIDYFSNKIISNYDIYNFFKEKDFIKTRVQKPYTTKQHN